MSVERKDMFPEYSISRIIKGGWHLAGGHGAINEQQAIKDMYSFVSAGITTFDCADIYTGVEALIGKFLKQYKYDFQNGDLAPVQIHTKYVPDYDALSTLTRASTNEIIERSLSRLGVEQLDLVQFAWWNNDVPGYAETALHLMDLKYEGKIRHIGVTNFDTSHLRELLDAGVKVVSNQIQYSFLDHRPEREMIALCEQHNINLFCYGALAGGFLADRYLGTLEPVEPLENRSLTKYKLIIDEFGGYDFFQEGLGLLRNIGDKYGKSIAQTACRYMLQKPSVAALIVGARNVDHLDNLVDLFSFQLDNDDLGSIQKFIKNAKGPSGPVYDLERDRDGRHGRIMKYNLNEEV